MPASSLRGAAALSRRCADAAILLAVEVWVRLRHPRLIRGYRLREPRLWGIPRLRRLGCIARPRTGNDKYLWRKIFDHDPRFVTLSDKLACKARVAAMSLPGLEIPRTLWQGTDPSGIPAALLRGDAVLKASHGYAMNLMIRGGRPGRAKVEAAGRNFMARRHGEDSLQWGYFGVPSRIFLEEMIAGAGPDLQELKLYTFGRQVVRVIHIRDRFGSLGAAAWVLAPGGGLRRDPEGAVVAQTPLDAPLPATAERAMEIAAELGAEFDHMRVDLLTDGARLWLSELTVYNLGGHFPGFGHDPGHPVSRFWDIRRSWFLTAPQPGWRGVYARALRRRLDAADRGAD